MASRVPNNLYEPFPVDDEFDKKLVLIWGYWVKKSGDMGIGDPFPPPPYVESALKINTEFCYIQINFFKIKSFEVTKIVKFAVITSLGQKGHF